MTTPAINLNQSFSSTTAYSEWVLSTGNPVFVNQNRTSLSFATRETRPVSGTSPVRSDKTRAPRAWSHELSFLNAMVGEVEWLVPSINRRRKAVGSWALGFSNSYNPISPSLVIPQAMLDRALLKALLRLKDSKIDLSVMALEARKTAGMLGRFSADMAKVLRSFKSGKNPVAGMRTLGRLANWKNVPGRYLEWCYGVTPLLQDIDGSMQKIAEAQNLQRPMRLKVVGVVEENDLINLGRVLPFNAGPGPHFEFECRRRRLVRYSLCYDVPSWALKDVSELGLSNPLSTLYELTPYSFVLDWVVPVGDWLSVLDAGNFLDFKEGTLTRMVTLSRPSFRSDPAVNAGITIIKQRLSGQSVRGLGLSRSVITSKPVFAGIPRLKGTFQLDKLAKGIALLTQVFARGR